MYALSNIYRLLGNNSKHPSPSNLESLGEDVGEAFMFGDLVGEVHLVAHIVNKLQPVFRTISPHPLFGICKSGYT